MNVIFPYIQYAFVVNKAARGKEKKKKPFFTRALPWLIQDLLFPLYSNCL